MRVLVVCRLPHVALRAARRLPFAANLPVRSIVACRLPLGAWCLPFCLAAAVCPGLSTLSLAASLWRSFPCARVALSVAFCECLLFPLSPHAESPLHLLLPHGESPLLILWR